MQERIINIIISFNVYSLHFVNSYWLKRSSLSDDLKYSTSLSILFVLDASVILFISDHFENVNWRLLIFIFGAYHLLIALIFNKRIIERVERYKLISPKYHFLFIGYLILGIISLSLLSL
jgi:hypothetical protein